MEEAKAWGRGPRGGGKKVFKERGRPGRGLTWNPNDTNDHMDRESVEEEGGKV